MTPRRLSMWLVLTIAAMAWVTFLVTHVAPPSASSACLAGLDTLEALPSTPTVQLLDEVEAACGR
jgi:hypothetical protein